MAPSSSQIRVLATLQLTMLSFVLEAREEYTGHVNPWFFTAATSPDRRTARSMTPSFGPTWQKAAHFFRLFLASGRVPLRLR